MKIRYRIVLALVAGASLQLCLLPNAAAQAHEGHVHPRPAASETTPAPNDWADGELRRIDLATGRLTIKHGEIRNLDMPPMTMVFGLRDGAVPAEQLRALKPGAALRFKAERVGGKLLVTAIAP